MRVKTLAIYTVVAASVAVLAAGCADSRTVTPAESPVGIGDPSTFASVLPTPDYVLPTASSDRAAVIGRLVTKRGDPVAGMIVFLESSTADHQAPEVLYAPPNDQPQAGTDETGTFVIAEVPEGEYVVVLYMPPFDLHLVTQPDGEQTVFINVKAGDVYDLGVFTVLLSGERE